MRKFLVLIAASAISAVAMAGGEKSAATFEALDKNADQQISKTEAAADKKLSESFATADANGDGYLSKTEYEARMKSTS